MQYLISLEIIESLLLQCVPISSGDARRRIFTNLSIRGTFEYIPFTYYYGLGLHLRLPFAPFLLTLFGKIQKEAGKQKETKKYFCFCAKMPRIAI